MSPRSSTGTEAGSRPRVEGDREQELFEATLEVLAEVGYDRLTMDAVASRAKASKATLYRKWDGKAALVIDALMSQKAPQVLPTDTGSLRGDLLALFCGTGGLTDKHQTDLLGSVITAIGRDAEFAAQFRNRFIAPKAAVARQIFERAEERGELREGIDINLVSTALPGIILHRMFLLGEQPTPDLIARVVDQVIIPAATHSG